VREIWFIVTLVTHSSGMSSSEMSRGIHHKCRHPLNPTKLYVSGWVESSRVVVYWMKSHNMRGCYIDMGWWKYIWLYDEYVVGSSLPVLFHGCIVCGCSSCDDHQFDWWEQMGEVLVVNKGMTSPLLSHLDWSYFIHDFFRATIPVSFYAFILYTLC